MVETIQNRLRVILAGLPQYPLVRDRAEEWIHQTMQADPERAEFHALRLYGFGGTEIGALTANASGAYESSGSARSIIMQKLLLSYPKAPGGQSLRDIELDPVVRAKFHRKFSCKSDDAAMRTLAKATGKRGWERYTPDDIAILHAADSEQRVIVGYLSPDTGIDGTDIKACHAAQLHLGRHLCLENGIDIGEMVICALDYARWDTVEFRIPFDAALESMMLSAGDFYWNEYVLKGKLPPHAEKRGSESANEEIHPLVADIADQFVAYKLLAEAATRGASRCATQMRSLLNQFRIGEKDIRLGMCELYSQDDFDFAGAVTALGPDRAKQAAIHGSMDGYDPNKLRELLRAADIEVGPFERDAIELGLNEADPDLSAEADIRIETGFNGMLSSIAEKGLSAGVKPISSTHHERQPRLRAA